MRVTTWTEYSLIIVLHLAQRGSDGEALVAARELSEKERLPGDFVEQILLKLRRAGIVSSVRGAKGGYRLAKAPAAITVHEVMSASERQMFEANCDHHKIDGIRCDPGTQCAIRPVWRELHHRIDGFLRSVTIADLMHSEPAVQELVSLGDS
jgi:Rrf2 family protein